MRNNIKLIFLLRQTYSNGFYVKIFRIFNIKQSYILHNTASHKNWNQDGSQKNHYILQYFYFDSDGDRFRKGP